MVFSADNSILIKADVIRRTFLHITTGLYVGQSYK